MNDRYLYRAKTRLIVGTYNSGKEDGELVKGYLYCDTGRWMIKQFEFDRSDYIDYEVDPSTICQCTGLKDKNGKLIWENDIVRDDNGNIYKAFWRDRYYQFSWICVKSDKLPIGAKWDFWSIRNYEIEVISSTIDNMELIE